LDTSISEKNVLVGACQDSYFVLMQYSEKHFYFSVLCAIL